MPTPWDYVSDQTGKDRSTEQGDKSSGGEYGQAGPQSTLNGDVPSDTYPNGFGYGYDANNREFSSDKSSTPEQFASETAGSQSNFADLQAHLMNSLDTIGSRVSHPASKPWTPPAGAEGE